MAKRQNAALYKLKRDPRTFKFEGPRVPPESRKHNFTKPTPEMLNTAETAVAQEKVRRVKATHPRIRVSDKLLADPLNTDIGQLAELEEPRAADKRVQMDSELTISSDRFR